MRNHNLVSVMACVAAGIFLVIKFGFVLHHDPQPAPIDNNTLTVIAALILCAGGVVTTRQVIQSGGRALVRARIRRDARESALEHTRARHRRAAELAADPTRARYAPLVERGEDWSDEKITYNEDPGRTATCEHLQSIERAMRGTGISVRLYRDGDVQAKCRIDLAGLKRAFNLASPVRYAEFFQGERHIEDYPIAFLICDEHKSSIHTLHPAEAGANNAPSFPAPASSKTEIGSNP